MLKAVLVFHEEAPLGYLTYRTYMRYELDPGDHMFWIRLDGISLDTSIDYKQFVKGDFLAGKIYLVEVRVEEVGVRMDPVNPFCDEIRPDRIIAVLNAKSSIKANKILEKREYHRGRIHESWAEWGMDEFLKFNEIEKVNQISSDWFIEPEKLIMNKKGNQ